MENRNFYNEILTEHNMHPDFKHDIEDADIVLDGINPSCGDEIQLKLKTDGDIITDGAFVGAWDDNRSEQGKGFGICGYFHENDKGRGV